MSFACATCKKNFKTKRMLDRHTSYPCTLQCRKCLTRCKTLKEYKEHIGKCCLEQSNITTSVAGDPFENTKETETYTNRLLSNVNENTLFNPDNELHLEIIQEFKKLEDQRPIDKKYKLKELEKDEKINKKVHKKASAIMEDEDGNVVEEIEIEEIVTTIIVVRRVSKPINEVI